MSSSRNITSETALDIIKNWFSNSPSLGIRRIGGSKTLYGRLFWVYIFWLLMVLMWTLIYTVIVKYIANPTKIHLCLRQDRDPIYFPAVTFCNVNPLRDDGFLYDIRKPFLTPGRRNTTELNESDYRKAIAAYIDRVLAAQVHGEKHPFVERGYKLNDLLITCMFNKRLCHRNLTHLFHPTYGNCYTFDNENHVQFEQTNDIRHDWLIDDNNIGEKNYKLFLELYLHTSEYTGYLEERTAFRIFIHRKHEVPILSQNSLFVRPNKYTKLVFSQRITSFSRQCRNDLTDDMKQIFLTRQVRYTQALCYKLCEQRFIQKQCNCIEPTLAVFYQFFSCNNNNNNNNPTETNINLCSVDNECLNSRNNFSSRELCRECLPECETIQYSVQSSYANYPNSNASSIVLQRVHNHLRNYKLALRNNIVAVEISASRYATEILTESPMYTWVDLISSIGGQAGLWIGVSLISFVEIVELFYLLIDRFYSYLFSDKNK